MALQYNFIDNNYTIYTPTEEPVVSKTNYLELFGDIGEISGIKGQLSNGVLLAEDNSSKMIVNNSPEDDESNFRNNYLTGEIQEDPYRPWQNYSELKYTNDELSKMSFEELIKKESLPIHITSGYRKNARTTSGKPSNHSFKDERGFSMAYDIKPAEGHSWKELEHVIYEDPTVIAWFKAHNWGILEEMYKDKRPGFYDVRGDYHFTKASGPHFHVGPDRYGVEWYNSKVKIPSSSKSKTKMSTSEWIEKLSTAYRKLGVSENGIKNLLSKNILESGWGKFTIGDFNYGNIKTGKNWTGKSKKDYSSNDLYRSYDSIDEYAKDEIDFLTRLYDFNDSDDIKTFTDKLQGKNNGKRKYAEGTNYKEKIKQIYKQI